MASNSPLLTELCSICHTSPPKYRCPRCFTRTCSLACTRRHKVWAQCTGIRNPASYRKRSELATPESIDMDYNFLTGVERGIERAERVIGGRGIAEQEEGGNQRNKGPAKGEVNLNQALERCGVRVERVPKGMSRGLKNRTGWNKKQRCISWTIEWIHPNSQKTIASCLETEPLARAYARLYNTKPNPSSQTHLRKKLRRTSPRPGNDDALAESSKLDSTPTVEPTPTVNPPEDAIDTAITHVSPMHTQSRSISDAPNSLSNFPAHLPSSDANPQPETETEPNPQSKTEPTTPHPNLENEQTPSPSQTTPSPPPSPPPLKFYLHIPPTPTPTTSYSQPQLQTPYPSSHLHPNLPNPLSPSPLPPLKKPRTTLLPIDDATQSLNIVLRGRSVVEFPTLYVFEDGGGIGDGGGGGEGDDEGGRGLDEREFEIVG